MGAGANKEVDSWALGRPYIYGAGSGFTRTPRAELNHSNSIMDKQKLDYFRNLLLEQRRRATEDLRADQSTALEDGDDGPKDPADLSELDLNRSTNFELADRQTHLLDDIDDALQRIEDGTYGQCVRCGKPLAEERLKAMPTARYDAACQALIDESRGESNPPSL